MKHKIAMILLVPALMVGAIGCAGPSNHTERGAATGVVLGGLAGAVKEDYLVDFKIGLVQIVGGLMVF